MFDSRSYGDGDAVDDVLGRKFEESEDISVVGAHFSEAMLC